jgi:hypothetical protein
MLWQLEAGHNRSLLDPEEADILIEYLGHFGNQQELFLLLLSDWRLETHRAVYKATLIAEPPTKIILLGSYIVTPVVFI